MDQMAKFVEAFRSLKKKGDCFFYATVTEITGNTCSAKLGDLELTDIKLKAPTRDDEDKLILTPKVGSSVILGCNDEDLRDVMIIKVDDPEKIFYKHKDITIDIDGTTGKIVINNGDNGGLTITPELKDQLAKMTKRLDTALDLLKQVPTGALHPNQAAWEAIYNPLVNPLEKEDFGDIENKDIKH